MILLSAKKNTGVCQPMTSLISASSHSLFLASWLAEPQARESASQISRFASARVSSRGVDLRVCAHLTERVQICPRHPKQISMSPRRFSIPRGESRLGRFARVRVNTSTCESASLDHTMRICKAATGRFAWRAFLQILRECAEFQEGQSRRLENELSMTGHFK